MNSKCADCGQEECRCDRLPMPAASPWRYDVENAPKDGIYFLMQDAYDGDYHIVKWCPLHDRFVAFSGSCHASISIIAFATINQPENDNEH